MIIFVVVVDRSPRQCGKGREREDDEKKSLRAIYVGQVNPIAPIHLTHLKPYPSSHFNKYIY